MSYWRPIMMLNRMESEMADAFAWTWYVEGGTCVEYVRMHKNEGSASAHYVVVGIKKKHVTAENLKDYKDHMSNLVFPDPSGRKCQVINGREVFLPDEGVIEIHFLVSKTKHSVLFYPELPLDLICYNWN